MSFLTELAQKGVIQESSVSDIETAAQTSGKTIEEVLLSRDVSPEVILAAKGVYYGLPTKSVDARGMSFDALEHIPEESARHYKVVPLGVEDGVLSVGIVDPDNIEAKGPIHFGKDGNAVQAFSHHTE